MDFLPDEKTMCHHTGFTRACRDIVLNCNCRKWVFLQGFHPNTGDPINKYDCADHWLPVLLVENSSKQNQTGAAVESLRNELVKRADAHGPEAMMGALMRTMISQRGAALQSSQELIEAPHDGG